ncbi:SMC family ATPase [Priestia megaterium]|nr:SMC family ATPase [Priestia megaterium]
MKPITLTIAGLHSFREKQVIDFDMLCSGGVFGIFGPTGSGKSSILDAMTLALYGKVERASNNTHGILNHAEEELKVSFTFELENANHKKRYTVERSFKRADELRVRSATSRLIEVGEETFVLADKTNDVNQQVQELLGLTIDDFTRAVVLPQGKFAEFLSLKGTERRQMLQRLFNLEQYGDRLNKKIRDHVQRLKNEIEKIQAEQIGLGEASAEKVKEAEQALQESVTLLQKRERELTDVEQVYEKQTKIWESQIEKLALEEKLTQLQQQQVEINAQQQKLAKAEQADKLIPYLETFEQAKFQKQSYEKKVELLQKQLEQMKVQHTASSQQYEEARAAKNEQQPKLVVRKEQLQQAKELEKKVKEQEMRLKKNEQQHLLITKEMQEKEQKLKEANQQYHRAVSLQQNLKKELQQIEVKEADRDLVSNAFREYENWHHDRQKVDEEIKKQTEKETELTNIKQMLEKEKKKQEVYEEKAVNLLGCIQHVYDTVCEREKEFEQLFVASEQITKNLRNHQREQQTKLLAQQLARELTEGERCPVCGALEHPNPISANQVEFDNLDEELTKLEAEISTLKEQKYQYSSLKLQLEQLTKPLVEAVPSLSQINHHETAVEQFENIHSADIIAYSQKVKVELKALHQDFLEAHDYQQQMLAEVKEMARRIEELIFKSNYYEKELKDTQATILSETEQLTHKKENWHTRYPGFSFETISSVQKEIKARAVKEQTLKERIDKSYQYFEQQQKAIEQLKDQYDQKVREEVQLQTTIENEKILVNEQKEQLLQFVGDGNIAEMLNEVVAKLEQLEDDEQKSYEKWKEIQSNYQTVETEEKAAVESLRDITSRFNQMAEQWTMMLQNSLFADTDEVKQAILSPSQMKLLDETIQQFLDNLKQTQVSIQKLDQQLNGQAISEQQWEETKELLISMRAAVKEANELKGAAQQTVTEIHKRHERFQVLESERLEKFALFEHYQKLQTIFKGNTFVEYIAEEQLMSISRHASERLAALTRQRYAIEVDSQGGFIMRDDANGGVKRPVSTLSGGETFLTSLALALSLSAQIQLRGEYPLQFFFLDEGFGTLDGELLDTVVTALEKLQSNSLSIGVISHVQELRARLPRRLIVQPAEASGRGTQVTVETL